MGKIVRNGVEFAGSSNSAENIKYDGTTSVKDAISDLQTDVDTLNSNLEWKIAGSQTGTTAISLPDSFQELSVIVTFDAESYTFNIPKIHLTSEDNVYTNGASSFDGTSSYFRYVRIKASLSKVALYRFDTGSSRDGVSNYASSSTIDVYYR